MVDKENFPNLEIHTCIASAMGTKLRSVSPHSPNKSKNEISFLNMLPVKHTGVRRFKN